MGCWNETCMLTHLPIQGDEDTVCFLIAERLGEKDTCHCDGVFAPISLPLLGKYDDYGRLKNINPSHEFLEVLSKVNFALYERDGESEQFTPIQTMKEQPHSGREITELLNLIRQGSLYCKNTEMASGYARVYMALIKKSYSESAINATIGGIPEGFTKIPGFSVGFRFADPLRTAIRDEVIPDPDVCKLVALSSFMDECRISWHPTCGSGSQNCFDYKYQVDFYKDMAEDAELLWRENQW